MLNRVGCQRSPNSNNTSVLAFPSISHSGARFGLVCVGVPVWLGERLVCVPRCLRICPCAHLSTIQFRSVWGSEFGYFSLPGCFVDFSSSMRVGGCVCVCMCVRARICPEWLGVYPSSYVFECANPSFLLHQSSDWGTNRPCYPAVYRPAPIWRAPRPGGPRLLPPRAQP